MAHIGNDLRAQAVVLVVAVVGLGDVDLAAIDRRDAGVDAAEGPRSVCAEAVHVALGRIADLEGEVVTAVINVDRSRQLGERDQLLDVFEAVLVLVGGHEEGVGEDLRQAPVVHQGAQPEHRVAQGPVAHAVGHQVQPPPARCAVVEKVDELSERARHGDARQVRVLAVAGVLPGRLNLAVGRPGEGEHVGLVGLARLAVPVRRDPVELLQLGGAGHRVLEVVGKAVDVDQRVALVLLHGLAQFLEQAGAAGRPPLSTLRCSSGARPAASGRACGLTPFSNS